MSTHSTKSSLKDIRSKMGERCRYMKIVDGELVCDDQKMGSFIDALIEEPDYHHVRFVGKVPERKFNMTDQEAKDQGFEKEVTLKIRVGKILYGLTISKGNVSRFEQYIDFLLSKGLEYTSQAVTRITATHIPAVPHPYNVLSFRLADAESSLKSAA